MQGQSGTPTNCDVGILAQLDLTSKANLWASECSRSDASRQESFWQESLLRFQCLGRKFMEKLRYILRNPVTRGLVVRKMDYSLRTKP
jgi:hypothetical protein